MKFIYSSDIHGDLWKYDKLIYLCKKNDISYIVLGGDLFSKDKGERIPLQKEFIRNDLKKYYERLAKNNITLIQIPGNDDLVIPCEDYYELIKDFPNIHDINNKKFDIDNISFIGLNYVLDAPFKRKDNIALEKDLKMPVQWSDEIYVDKCQKVISKEEWVTYRNNYPMMEDLLLDLPKPTLGNDVIYVLHDPPYGVGLDLCRDGTKAGSHAIFDFITKSNAMFSLHGHIHESYFLTGVWNVLIGNTISIQVGQSEKGEEDLHYVIIDTLDKTFDFKQLK